MGAVERYLFSLTYIYFTNFLKKGWSSEATCGPNYSCFFSGFNYQCCPTDGNDELINSKLNNKEVKKSEDERDECPDDALAVLDSAGDVMYCDGAGKCPNVYNLFYFAAFPEIPESFL